MSLYKESEKALSELNEIVSKVRDSKEKLNISADSMTDALKSFVVLNKPVYTIVQRDLNLDKAVKTMSDEVRVDMSTLRGALNRDIERSVEAVNKSTVNFMEGIKQISHSLDTINDSFGQRLNDLNKRFTNLFTVILIVMLINVGLTGFLLSKLI